MVNNLSSRELRKLSRQIDPSSCNNQLRVAILGYRSTQFFSKFLLQAALIEGISLEIYEGDYQQVEMELLHPDSGLYQHHPRICLLLNSVSYMKKSFYKTVESERPFFAERYLERVEEYGEQLNSKDGSSLMVFNIPEKKDEVFGHFGHETASSFRYQVSQINAGLMKLAIKFPTLHIFDEAGWVSHYGLQSLADPAMYVNADVPYNLEAEAKLAQEVVNYMGVNTGKLKKCLILDLDNTLWGGIIGDDGVGGIQLGSLGIGKAFSDLQQWVKELKNRGIILAVCSKNVEATAQEPFLSHPEMVLKLEDIAVFVANWNNKADNIRYIQQILNIGFDSMVFLDDNPSERELVRKELPELTIPDLPEDPGLFLPYLSALGLFETFSFSPTDKNRTLQYRAEAERSSQQKNFTRLEDFLSQLKMKAEIIPFQERSLQRIVQLSQRSNQYNLQTHRYTEAEVIQLIEHPQLITLQISMEDKFGHHGLISLLAGRIQGQTLHITNWIMSCRVINKGVERAALNVLVGQAKEKGITRILGQYLPSPKNSMVEKHYESLGFQSLGNGNWELDLSSFSPLTHFISVNDSIS